MAATDQRIELAARSDAPSIYSLACEMADTAVAQAWREEVSQAMANPNANVAVVRQGEDLLAFGIMEYSDPDARLLLFAVTPRRRRQGVGTALLVWFEATALVAGMRSIEVEVKREDAAARSFYRRAGYRKLLIEGGTYCKSLEEIRLQSITKPHGPRQLLKRAGPRK